MAFIIPDNLKSRKDVPGMIRKTVGAFQVGLGEECIVWYEPLYDPTGEKPHFVVLIPDRGIVLLEVFKAKECKIIGTFRGNIRIERDGREIELLNPLTRAERLANVLRKRIDNESRLKGLKLPVSCGAVFPYMDVGEGRDINLAKLVPEDRCIFKKHINDAFEGHGEAQLLRCFIKMLQNNSAIDIDEDIEKILRGIIQPETVIDAVKNESEGIKGTQITIFRPPSDEEDVIRIMDLKQEAMAKSLGGGHRVIRGVAGSGKTLILVFRAKLLARSFPQKRFLITCYTRSLAGELKKLLNDFGNIEVINLDKLMWNLIKKAGLKHPGYKDGNAEKIPEIAMQALNRGVHQSYHGIFLDEAQDFGTTALQLVVNLLRGEDDDLIIVADAAQNIFRRKFSWKQAGIQAQGRTRILRVNYRNTKEILEFAALFLLSSPEIYSDEIPDPEDENAVIPPESAARGGSRPDVYIVESEQEAVKKAINVIEKAVSESTPPKNIGLLYASSHGEKGYSRAYHLNEGLKKRGIDVFWLTNPNNKGAKDQLAEASQPVILTTVHSAKGLEFPNVVFCGIWNKRDDTESNRKLAYVGMTRAMEKLTVITCKNTPLVEDLGKACKAGTCAV